MVAQIMNQFESSVFQPALQPEKSTEQPTEQPVKNPQIEAPAMSTVVGITLPTVENIHEYEFLPGHFVVRRILQLDAEDAKKPSYTVRLQSGERATMTYDKLMKLENSVSALDQFNPDSDSDDELLVVGNRSISPEHHFGGDGVSDSSGGGGFGNRQNRNTRRRTTATVGQYTSVYGFEDSDQSDEEEEPSRSHRYATRRLRRGSRKSDRMSTNPSEGYSTSNPNRRQSSRARRSLRHNLRERFEDEFSETESIRPRQQKYSGAREAFQEIPRDDEFRIRHFACCATCSVYEDDPEKGDLVFCQGCSSSYHQVCLGPRTTRDHLVTKIDEGNFVLQCRRCLGIANGKHDVAPHLGFCAICKEEGNMSQPLRQRLTSKEEQQLRISNEGTDPITPVDMAQVNNIDNVLFRCASCQRAFHSKHLHSATGDDNSEVFADHIKHWQCSDCSEAPGEIDELVAWRPLDAQLKTSVGLIGEAVPEIEKEYLIKWKQKSYFRTKWMRGDWVWGFGSPIMRRAFYNSPKSENPIWTTEKAIPEENLRVDIVFDVTYREGTKTEDKSNPEMVESAFVKYKGLNYESSVVESPPDPLNKDRWEDFKIAFCDWLLRDTIQPPNRSALKAHLSKARQKNFEKDLALRVQPELLTGGELMEYQMDGINWLYYKFLRKENAVLADDMGLGKTVQVIGLFATLIQTHECWPFLVVVPNSTVPNWRREIKMWTPNVRVSTYFGSAFARQTAKDYEMFPQGGHNLRSHVVIASYESMVDDDANARVLRKVRWAGLVVDEGQRLKNDKSQLYECLRRMKFDFKAILTGTPLQNNIRELFNLLQFINPELDAEELEERYSELNKENISALHEMIRPCFLRRTKAEVLPFLPPMVQIILPVSMSVVQKKLYKSILGKNPELIKMICKKQTGQLKKADRHNLNNILVQLRKCICHPFLYNRDIEEQTHDPLMAHRHLVEASGKLQLLNLMLPKLRERGNRVLIFSQFLQNLDIVEDFLTGLDMKYCRLDGNLSSREKQQQIDSFNAEDSSYFAFLLSTRSGGVGINLATADTVIIMDPDFNPKQDMQALSRAHRIGQKNTVLVFHLTTKASVEERIMERGKKKLALDHVLIERMEADEDEEDLESILRHGAQALFEDDDAGHVQYDPESIDRILDRSQVEKAEETSGSTPNGSSDQPQFNFARIWQNDTGTLEEVTETEDKPVDDTIWDQILQEREQDAIKESYRKAEGFGRGKRKRNTVNYESTVEEVHDFDGVQSSPLKVSQKQAHGSDTDFQQEDNGEASDSPDETDDMELDQMEIDTSLVNVKARPFKRVKLPSPPPSLPMGVDGTQDTTHHLCIACNQHHALGRCPLKIAGVEHCPLCGLAHLGRNRSCPHLRSEVQVKRMIEALKESKEPSGYVAIAKKYLQGILGDFGQRARKKAAKDAERELAQSMPQASGPSAPAPQSTSHSMQQYSPAVTSALVPNPEPLGQHGSVSSNDFALPYQQTHSQQPSHSRQYQQ
ncbi:hypothetical protein N7533_009252 [Penicillium manginii]|uniref:uncharacterized protein n=1 Tax=Penicillium manginii TaxID=203109 RepID=UPI002549291D|nr:uncharacterized protein N7533_009252 [Penicillium manginii]KAJ5744382.1 hypothetical protein N7533_009252 [Penicillium manginii]